MAISKNRAENARGIHFFSFSLGLWMVASPFILSYSHGPATVNSILIGLAVMWLSYVRLHSSNETWSSWALAGVGLWLVFSPFVFGYTKTATYWNDLLFGIALIVAMISGLGQAIRHHSHLVH